MRPSWRTLVSGLAALLLGVAPFSLSTAQTRLEMTTEQATSVAREAYRAGNVPLANALGHGLVEARPEDPRAHLLLAATEPLLGRPKAGREAGALAFKLAEDKALKREAAWHTGRAALVDERYAAAQWWLRRAYQNAETEEQRDRIARDFGAVRRQSPWLVQLDFNVAPNSNINGGADSGILVIEGVPSVGILSGEAQALSGLTSSLSGTVDYALSRGARHRTSLTFSGYRNWNTLSEKAKDLAPRAKGSDFDYAVAELRLSHRISDPGGFIPDTFAVAFGQTWYGQEKLDTVRRVTLARRVDLGGGFALRVKAEGEHRISDRDQEDIVGRELRFDLTKRLSSGDFARVTYAGTNVFSDNINADYRANRVELGYVMGREVSGMRLSGNLAWRERTYDAYRIGFISVPNGRHDEEWTGEINLHLDSYDYMGFAPVISVTGRDSRSNVSRFEGDALGLSVGFRSAF